MQDGQIYNLNKLDKFKETKEKQSLNIRFILVTLLVSKLDKSNEVNDLQS